MTTSYPHHRNPDNARSQSGFLRWMSVQRADLKELLDVLTVVPKPDTEQLHTLSQKTIQHLYDYQHTRSNHHKSDSLSIHTPSSFENSMFWLRGFKPSIYIGLLFSIAQIGSEKGVKLSKLCISENIGTKTVMDCSETQVKLIKALHAETVISEDMISFKVANLQEGMMIEPLVIFGSDSGMERALAAHWVAFKGVVVDADDLRVKVLKELIDHILTPLQGVHLLVASTRLHLSVHMWGNK